MPRTDVPSQSDHAIFLEESLIPSPNPVHTPTEFRGRENHGSNYSIESGCVSATRVDGDLHEGGSR